MQKEIIDRKAFTFFTDKVGYETIQTKAGKKHYVTGYISTGDLDLDNDIVTEACMKNMIDQLKNKNIKLDLEHEAFVKDRNILPIGMIVDAELDSKGVWVKAEINADSPSFDNVWGSIKNGFIDAFSITFATVDKVTKSIGGKIVRLLNKINLLNVALTGNPINKSCRINNIFMKSIQDQGIIDFSKTKKTAGDNMSETKTAEQFEAEKKALEEKLAEAEKKAEEATTAKEEADKKLATNEEAAKEKEAAEKKAAEEKTAVEAEAKAKADAKETAETEKKALQDKLDEQSTQLKAIQEKLKMPVMKSATPTPGTEIKGDVIQGPLSFIR